MQPRLMNPVKKISDFVENYIQGNIPEDGELSSDLVNNLKTHRHTSTCKERFNFWKINSVKGEFVTKSI